MFASRNFASMWIHGKTTAEEGLQAIYRELFNTMNIYIEHEGVDGFGGMWEHELFQIEVIKHLKDEGVELPSATKAKNSMYSSMAFFAIKKWFPENFKLFRTSHGEAVHVVAQSGYSMEILSTLMIMNFIWLRSVKNMNRNQAVAQCSKDYHATTNKLRYKLKPETQEQADILIEELALHMASKRVRFPEDMQMRLPIEFTAIMTKASETIRVREESEAIAKANKEARVAVSALVKRAVRNVKERAKVREIAEEVEREDAEKLGLAKTVSGSMAMEVDDANKADAVDDVNKPDADMESEQEEEKEDSREEEEGSENESESEVSEVKKLVYQPARNSFPLTHMEPVYNTSKNEEKCTICHVWPKNMILRCPAMNTDKPHKFCCWCLMGNMIEHGVNGFLCPECDMPASKRARRG